MRKSVVPEENVAEQAAGSEIVMEEPERKRSLLTRFLLFMGTSMAIVALFALLISPVVLGYIWFFKNVSSSIDFFDFTAYHPPHYYKIIKSCAIGCALYSFFVTWRTLKFFKPRGLLFLALFCGSFVFSSFVCSQLYDKHYF